MTSEPDPYAGLGPLFCDFTATGPFDYSCVSYRRPEYRDQALAARAKKLEALDLPASIDWERGGAT